MMKLPATFVSAKLGLAAAAIVALSPAAPAEAHSDRHYGYGYDRGYDRSGFRCVAQARRLGGDGPHIPGIGGRGFGHGACREALSDCNHELNRYRRHTGDAPYARCVIVRRG